MLQTLLFPNAELYLQGAHLTRFKDWLFVSSLSRFEAGQPIRGGIPVVFPWFGPKRDASDAPQHGWARTMEWEVEERSETGATLRLAHEDWFVQLAFSFGEGLGVSLHVRNDGPSPRRFECALHTYFAVGEISDVAVEGLEGRHFIDKPAGTRQTQNGPIQFSGEVDRIYLDVQAPLRIKENEMGYELRGEWPSAIVWNPGPQKAAMMADLGNDEWKKFVCVEVGAVAENAPELSTGQTWRLNLQIARLQDKSAS